MIKAMRVSGSNEALDVTTDSKAALKQHGSLAVPAATYLSEWSEAWQERPAIAPTWVKAHLTSSEFTERFGATEQWRWHLNQRAR